MESIVMARRAHVNMTIEGNNVTDFLAPYLTAFTYKDSLEGEADVAEVTLHNCDGIWTGSHFPQRGSSARIEIVKENWNADGTIETLNLGVFELDEITSTYPPLTVKIKFNSVSNGAKVRGVAKFRSWEKTNLRRIARDIADEAGLGLFFDAEDFQLERVEQSQESSLALLKKLCTDNGLILKVSDNKIIIADAMKYEARAPVATVTYGTSAIVNFSARATLSQIYGDANVYFKPNGINDFFLGMFDMLTGRAGVDVRGITEGLARNAGNVPLVITQHVNSEREARRLARSKMRDKNKHEFEINMTLVGNFSYVAGAVIKLEGFGTFSGNFIVDEATHSIDDAGYNVGVRCHRCLVGY